MLVWFLIVCRYAIVKNMIAKFRRFEWSAGAGQNLLRKILGDARLEYVASTKLRILVYDRWIWLRGTPHTLKLFAPIPNTIMGRCFFALKWMHENALKFLRGSMLSKPVEATIGFMGCSYDASTLSGSIACHLGASTWFETQFVTRIHKNKCGASFFWNTR